MSFFDRLFGVESPPLGDQLRAIGLKLGIPLVACETGGGTFEVPFDDREYIVVVTDRGSRAAIAVLSCIRFPPGRAPSEIVSVLADRNRGLSRWDWKLIDNERHSYFALMTGCPMNRLDATNFIGILREMLPETAALDRTLYQNGYVS